MRVLNGLLLISLVGCQSQCHTTSNEFKPYAKLWTDLTGRSAATPIYWESYQTKIEELTSSETSENNIASCSVISALGKWHNKHIMVNDSAWLALGGNECFKALIVVHELVHCEVEVEHHADSEYYELSDGTITLDIMAATIDTDAYCSLEDIKQQVIERWAHK